MLTQKGDWVEIVEVNPPKLPSMAHRRLQGTWENVLVTDNPFKQIRVSPYAFAARITHDIPEVHPTVVVSTRDRNILAIESEVRGALGNGVESFLVVVGDTLPEVDHWANHYEIVEHLKQLQARMPAFEVGMTSRFRKWMFRRRCEVGAQFFITGPILDPDTVEPSMARLELRDDDPPVYLGVVPPFSLAWLERLRGLGAVESGDRLRARLRDSPGDGLREVAWEEAREIARRAKECGFSGVVLMGLKFETLVEEAREAFRPEP